MVNNEPVRQHLVPRCYLKHFSLAKKKEWFIKAYDKSIENPKVFTVNIKNICVETDFYTFKKLDEKDKRFMERYYSNTIEADYTEVYNALINSKSTRLSDNLRFKIISFVIYQFFRTSRITNAFNNLWERTLENSSILMTNLSDKKVYLQGGGHIDFTNKTLEEIKVEETNKNREMINIKNYELFKKWTIEKIDSIIVVNRCSPKSGYIIGDNPIITHGHIFDPNASLYMPLNHNHCLTLMSPNNGVVSDTHNIHHIEMDAEHSELSTTIHNIAQFEKAQRFVMGKQELIEATINSLNNFNEDEFKSRTDNYLNKLN